MKKFVTYNGLGKNGRTGNQLFQIFTTWAYAKRYDLEVVFPTKVPILDLLNINYKIKDVKHLIEETWSETGNLKYTEIEEGENINLNGYFQSPRYFYDLPESAYLFSLQNESKTEDIYKTLKYITDADSCFIHVRRGDYVQVASLLLSPEYFYDAIEIMKNRGIKRFFVFSDDIEYTKVLFKKYDSENNMVYIYGGEFDSLWAMSICPNGILSNSSFSWWGARLNNSCKQIIAPKHWFNKYKIDTSDLFYDNWNTIWKSNYIIIN